jgi:hypothetical protein
MLCQGSQRQAWLRLVPEPERLLPVPVAALRTGAPEPAEESVSAEAARLESVILHGSARDWLGYLSGVVVLVTGPFDPDLRPHALLAAEVVRDHHRLLQGLSPWLSLRTRGERLQLERVVADLRRQSR